MHGGIAQASQHVFDGKHAFEGLIKAGALISHFFFPASTCHAARIFCYETWSTYKKRKKNVIMISWKLSAFFMAFM